jgi:ferritin
MLKKSIEQKLNEQINAELFSSYLYLSMSAYFESNNLTGFANWMKVQAQEEITHAMKFFNFIHERGGQVTLDAIEKPEHTWKDPIHVIDEAYGHEQKVTKLIHDLVSISIDEKDFATQNFLQWFVNEQVEEEATASLLLERLKMIEGKNPGLFLLDKELQTRQFIANGN